MTGSNAGMGLWVLAPRYIMKAYVNLLDITVHNLDEQICWEFWSDGDPGDLDGTTDPNKVSL
jgi:hypothetical protein